MSLLLALQGSIPDITGSGASSFGFTDAGTALLVFQGTGASAVRVIDAGAGLETFLSSGASAVKVTDVGAGIVVIPITGTGATFLIFTSSGAGEVPGSVGGGDSGGGGGFNWKHAFPEQKRSKRKSAKRPPRTLPEIFAYASSESAVFFAGSGRGDVSMLGSGGSRVRLRGRGKGRMEESAAAVIELLLMSEEL